jgi:glyoxylase-like metal-dependent hydrolase (beta-lactamase superfamily II)
VTAVTFLAEPPPPRGVARLVAPGVRRLVADNPGPMTYHGTNTYLIEASDGMVALDPGPDQLAHVDAILREAGGALSAILVSHGHADHVGAVAALAGATGAPVFRWHADGSGLRDGDRVAGLEVLHTPGHAPDHVCFARADGVMFTADHVLSFATSVVIPPAGDMAEYMAGLQRLTERADRLFLPGHGPPIHNPQGFATGLLAHRRQREAAILTAVRQGRATASEIVDAIYLTLDPRLHGAAQASVLAHLNKLALDGQLVQSRHGWAPL